MKCELKARARRETVSRVMSTFVALLMGATFVHAGINGEIPALFVSLGVGLALVITVLGRFPE